jgi:endonuclease/exonuclease/phosphatase family metal-dependent hydrolase
MKASASAWILASVIALMACSDGDGGGTADVEELIVIDQNILHGIIDEDPQAEPFDRFPERIELFARAVAAEQPDVLFMQEVVGNPMEDYPDTRAVILDALGEDYQAAFGNFLGGPIDEPGLGQMTFTRLPVVASENRSVSEIRSVQHLALETQNGVIDVYNAHLEGTGAVLPTGEDAAVAEMDAVIAFIDETSTGAVILAGDLNAEPGDPSIQRLVAAGFIDALAEAGQAECEAAGDPGCTNSAIPLGDNPERVSDRRIDYVFVRSGARNIEVAEARLFLDEAVDISGGRSLRVSDHIGLYVRVRVSGAER